jgi:hypothetical protein
MRQDDQGSEDGSTEARWHVNPVARGLPPGHAAPGHLAGPSVAATPAGPLVASLRPFESTLFRRRSPDSGYERQRQARSFNRRLPEPTERHRLSAKSKRAMQLVSEATHGESDSDEQTSGEDGEETVEERNEAAREVALGEPAPQLQRRRTPPPPPREPVVSNPFYATSIPLPPAASGEKSRRASGISLTGISQGSPSDRSLPMRGPGQPRAAAGASAPLGSSASDVRTPKHKRMSVFQRLFGGTFLSPGNKPASSSTTKTDADKAEELRRRKQKLRDAVLLSGSKAGIPLREGLQSLYRVQRSKFLAEGALFLVHFFLLVAIAGDTFPTTTAFKQHSAVKQAIGAPLLEEVHSIADVWVWAQTSLAPGLWPTELYPGRPLAAGQLSMVAMYNQLAGPVELRVARVGKDSCDMRRFQQFGRRFDTPDGSCYAEFVPGPGAAPDGNGRPGLFQEATEATDPYGGTQQWSPLDRPLQLGDPPYRWSLHNDDMEGQLTFGVDTYGYGGYSVILPKGNVTQVLAALARLEANGYLDQTTRAVAVMFSVYNTNTRLLHAVRAIIEVFPSGLVSASWKSASARIILYENATGFARAVAESLFCLLLLLGVIRECRRLYHTHPRRDYFLDVRNLYEVAYHSVGMALVGAWLAYVMDITRQSVDVSSESRVSFWSVVRLYGVCGDLAGFFFVLSAVKLFKFLSLEKRMAVLWLTLQRASYDVALFLIGFLCVIAGFSLAGTYIFGQYIRGFHTVAASMSTLVRFAIDNLEYEEIESTRPGLAPWFMYTFAILVGLLFSNILIAIITLALEEVHAESITDETWKEGMPELSLEALMAARKAGRRIKNCCPILYNVFCYKRARKARKLRNEQQLRANVINPSLAQNARKRGQSLSLMPNNALAKQEGIRHGETLDSWMVRRLLDGALINDVRKRAQAVLEEDERLTEVMGGGVSALQRLQPWRSFKSQRSETELEPSWRECFCDRGSSYRSPSWCNIKCCRCCVRCCCCASRAGGLGSGGSTRSIVSSASAQQNDLYEDGAVAKPISEEEETSDNDDVASGMSPLPMSSSRGLAKLVSPGNPNRRSLPTYRTLFHAVRAEAERLEVDSSSEEDIEGSKAPSGFFARFTPRSSMATSIHSSVRKRGRLGGESSMQMRVWEAQERFLRTMRDAARAARRRTSRSVQLLGYFQHAWLESGGRAVYMSLQELCLLTSGVEGCKHKDCVAKRVVEAYQAWKSVILLKGEEKISNADTTPIGAQDTFFTIKVNRAGRKQERFVVVDRMKQQLKGFDMKQSLRRVLPLSQLVQIEQSAVDSTRLNLVFADGVGANWSLLFITPAERQRFCRVVYEVVMKRRHSGVAQSGSSPMRGTNAFANAVLQAAARRQSAVQSPPGQAHSPFRSRADGSGGEAEEEQKQAYHEDHRALDSRARVSRFRAGTGMQAAWSVPDDTSRRRSNTADQRIAPVPSERSVTSGVTAPWEWSSQTSRRTTREDAPPSARPPAASALPSTRAVRPSMTQSSPQDDSDRRTARGSSGWSRAMLQGQYDPSEQGEGDPLTSGEEDLHASPPRGPQAHRRRSSVGSELKPSPHRSSRRSSLGAAIITAHKQAAAATLDTIEETTPMGTMNSGSSLLPLASSGSSRVQASHGDSSRTTATEFGHPSPPHSSRSAGFQRLSVLDSVPTSLGELEGGDTASVLDDDDGSATRHRRASHAVGPFQRRASLRVAALRGTYTDGGLSQRRLEALHGSEDNW